MTMAPPVPVMSSSLVKTEEEDTDDEMFMQHSLHVDKGSLANDVAAGAENAVYVEFKWKLRLDMGDLEFFRGEYVQTLLHF